MSTFSSEEPCMNCGESATVCFDSREGESIWCSYCGLTQEPKVYQCTLEELNLRRANENEGFGLDEMDDGYLSPLTELPKWTFR